MSNPALVRILAALAPHEARLVAVSKTKPPSVILEIYDEGQRIFGENRVQELVQKQPQLPTDIQWHMIGHLQTNKVKAIAPFVQMIHSVDSIKLLREINKQAARYDRVIEVLIQVKIGQEQTKYGVAPPDLDAFFSEMLDSELPHVRVCGLMGMATFTSDQDQVRSEFAQLSRLFQAIRDTHFAGSSQFVELSMGMSGDYQVALEEGSTLVRIGSLIFGARPDTFAL